MGRFSWVGLATIGRQHHHLPWTNRTPGCFKIIFSAKKSGVMWCANRVFGPLPRSSPLCSGLPPGDVSRTWVEKHKQTRRPNHWKYMYSQRCCYPGIRSGKTQGSEAPNWGGTKFATGMFCCCSVQSRWLPSTHQKFLLHFVTLVFLQEHEGQATFNQIVCRDFKWYFWALFLDCHETTPHFSCVCESVCLSIGVSTFHHLAFLFSSCPEGTEVLWDF